MNDWILISTVAGATMVIVGAVLWVGVRLQAAIERTDDRVSHLLAGVSLLTDTTEGALRDVAAEITRLATRQEGSTRPRAATQRRVTAAARRGRSVHEIAATEEVSEGEVRLRLQLEQAAKERAHASMR